MLLVLIGSLILMGTAFTLLARAAGMSRVRTKDTLAQIDTYGFSVTAAETAPAGAARSLVDAVATLLGQAWELMANHLSAFRTRAIVAATSSESHFLMSFA